MGNMLALLDIFRKGSCVSDPVLWKNGGAALQAALVGFILAVNGGAKAAGYDLHIDELTATAIAGGICAVVGIVTTYATSDKVGILPAKPIEQDDPGMAG